MEPPKPKEDTTNYVDVPWTQERILDAIEDKVRSWIVDELENWHIMKTVHTEKMDLTVTDVAAPDSIDKPKVVVAGGGEIPEGIEIPLTPPKWTDQAKELGIPLMKETGGRRKKDDVLQDIEDALEVKV
jgi:hypothetical protein